MVRPFHLVIRIQMLTLANRPSVPVNVQNAVLSRLILSLEGVAAYNATKITQRPDRKKRRGSQQTGPNKRSRTSAGSEDGTSDPIALPVGTSTIPNEPMDTQDADQEPANPTEPPIISHLILGINQVTKRLERQARAYRQTLDVTNTPADNGTPEPPPSRLISIVFVCRADVDPPLLISHLPTLVASCNSSRNSLTNPESHPPIKLVPVPKGSESLLADATGLRRLAVLALDVIVSSHSAAI
jgi:ribonuclease P/MRP protein subunit POP3